MEINKFKQAPLEKAEFIYTLELVPGRGSRGKTQDEVLRLAEKAALSGLVHALSIPHGPTISSAATITDKDNFGVVSSSFGESSDFLCKERSDEAMS